MVKFTPSRKDVHAKRKKNDVLKNKKTKYANKNDETNADKKKFARFNFSFKSINQKKIIANNQRIKRRAFKSLLT